MCIGSGAGTNTNETRNATVSEVVAELKASGAFDVRFSKIDSGVVELIGGGWLVPMLIEAKTSADTGRGCYPNTLATEAGDMKVPVPGTALARSLGVWCRKGFS